MNSNHFSTPSLTDSFGREVNYLRLSVTDRCNLRCTYCMAEDMTFLPKQQILSLEELRDTAIAFVELGVRKIRLTGGEPLIRRDILKLVGSLASLPRSAVSRFASSWRPNLSSRTAPRPLAGPSRYARGCQQRLQNWLYLTDVE